MSLANVREQPFLLSQRDDPAWHCFIASQTSGFYWCRRAYLEVSFAPTSLSTERSGMLRDG
jgi:hypothetical protein